MPRGGYRKGAGRKSTKPVLTGQAAPPSVPTLETLKPEVTEKITSRGKGERLSAGERKFVEEYLIDLNASAAYLRAGYKGDKGGALAARLIGRDRVQRAIQQAMAERTKRVHVDQDRVLTELARIGFADLRRMFEQRESKPVTAEALYDKCRNTEWTLPFEKLSPAEQSSWKAAADVASQSAPGGYFLKSPDQLDDDTAAAIAGVEVTTKNIGDGEVEYVHKIRTVDKLGALTTLAKHLGMLKDAVDHKHSGSVELAWLS